MKILFIIIIALAAGMFLGYNHTSDMARQFQDKQKHIVSEVCDKVN